MNNEIIETILKHENVRIEKITSRGQSSPKDFWYDQFENEWVLLVKGHAKLQFEAPNRTVELRAGDCLNIPAHQKHRVEWTDPNLETVWIAVFY